MLQPETTNKVFHPKRQKCDRSAKANEGTPKAYGERTAGGRKKDKGNGRGRLL